MILDNFMKQQIHVWEYEFRNRFMTWIQPALSSLLACDAMVCLIERSRVLECAMLLLTECNRIGWVTSDMNTNNHFVVLTDLPTILYCIASCFVNVNYLWQNENFILTWPRRNVSDIRMESYSLPWRRQLYLLATLADFDASVLCATVFSSPLTLLDARIRARFNFEFG